MTPLLPSASVGTLETRTVIEPVRSLIGPRIKYIEAACVDIDPTSKVITCSSEDEKLVIPTDPGSIIEGGASSKKILDSGKISFY
jgi:NADH dehydrogenase FAD-containing subunit